MVARLTKPRVFVVMPFGLKQDHDGSWIDFDAVFDDLFNSALQAEFHVHRADKDSRTGDILEDMFKDILLADLVLVDVSIDNPNVWYELGVRHALQARGATQHQDTASLKELWDTDDAEPPFVRCFCVDCAGVDSGGADTADTPRSGATCRQSVRAV